MEYMLQETIVRFCIYIIHVPVKCTKNFLIKAPKTNYK